MVNVSETNLVSKLITITVFSLCFCFSTVCVFLSNGTCVCVDVEHGVNTNSATILKTLIETEELRLPPFAMNVFALWMISPELGKEKGFLTPLRFSFNVRLLVTCRSAAETPSQTHQDLRRMGAASQEIYQIRRKFNVT
jgi:hypothetical protein